MLRDQGPSDRCLFRATVVENTPDGEMNRLIISPDGNIRPVPGQFIHLLIPGGDSTDPLLRRPFSVGDWDADTGQIHLFVLPVGRVSEQLVRTVPGDRLDCLGPLGTGFSIEDAGDGQPIVIAGGTGAAPLVFLAKRLGETGCPPVVFVGAAREARLFGIEDFESSAISTRITTEDGSVGRQGLIIDEVRRHLQEGGDVSAAYCCGPRPMLSALAGLFLPRGISSFGSFEERMACGVGACLGCSLRKKSSDDAPRYARVCDDGPVFDLEEVHFE